MVRSPCKFNILAVIKGNCLYRPCSDFMDMLRRLISCRIIIIIITWFSVNLRRNCRPCGVKTFFWTTGQTQYRHAVLRAVRPVINRKERKKWFKSEAVRVYSCGIERCCVIKVAAGRRRTSVLKAKLPPSSSSSLPSRWMRYSPSNVLVAGHRKSAVLLTGVAGRVDGRWETTAACGRAKCLDSTRSPRRNCCTPSPLVWAL